MPEKEFAVNDIVRFRRKKLTELECERILENLEAGLLGEGIYRIVEVFDAKFDSVGHAQTIQLVHIKTAVPFVGLGRTIDALWSGIWFEKIPKD